MKKILIIEDDTGIIRPLSLYIENAGYIPIHCDDGAKALEMFAEHAPDLILLDINLPGKDGITICREIRQKSSLPIIVISAREGEQDKLLLFDLGVDDYVSKPFSQRELIARIAAVFKRSENQKKSSNKGIIAFHDLELNSKNFSVNNKGVSIKLTKTEFLILEYCLKNSQNIITRETLMKDIMGYDNYIYDRTIDTHMKNLRKKLGESIEIETLRGVGYRVRSL